MQEPLISIIIPCYNSERFISSTLEMLLKQDLADCEIIIVNDGSTDNTLSILEEYKANNNNIIIINQPNSGVSVARNNGINASNGKYVYFLDSDDAITSDALSYCKYVLNSHPNCQMYTFGYNMKVDKKIKKHYVFPQFNNQTFMGIEMMKNFLSKRFCIHIGSCIYKRQFLIDNKLQFQNGIKIGEDVLFILKSLYLSHSVFYSMKLIYVYQVRNDSVMQGYKSYSIEQYKSQTIFYNFLLPIGEKDQSLYNYINFFLLFSYISNLLLYIKSDLKDEELNAKFIIDSKIRYKSNFTNNIKLWFIMNITMFIPIKLLLKIIK